MFHFTPFLEKGIRLNCSEDEKFIKGIKMLIIKTNNIAKSKKHFIYVSIMTSLSKVSKYLLIILFPSFLILTNFNYLIFNRSFFESLQKKVKSEINLDSRIYYSNNLIDYYQNKELLDQKFYSYQAQLHLKDVKNLLIATKVIIGLSIILIVSLIIIIVHEKAYESIFTALVYGTTICLLAIGALGIGLSSYFDFLFQKMHKILFTNTLWLFPVDDTLVLVFPNEFFVLFANHLVINTVGTCLLLLGLSICGKIYIRRQVR